MLTAVELMELGSVDERLQPQFFRAAVVDLPVWYLAPSINKTHSGFLKHCWVLITWHKSATKPEKHFRVGVLFADFEMDQSSLGNGSQTTEVILKPSQRLPTVAALPSPPVIWVGIVGDLNASTKTVTISSFYTPSNTCAVEFLSDKNSEKGREDILASCLRQDRPHFFFFPRKTLIEPF